MVISEQRILELQDLFLTNGVHYLPVDTLKDGRLLIYTFLDALGCFELIGCLSRADTRLRSDIFNINHIKSDLDTFLLEDFNCDFVWVECTKKDTWHYHFEQKVRQLGLDRHLSLIVVIADA